MAFCCFTTGLRSFFVPIRHSWAFGVSWRSLAVFCWRGGDRELFCWVRAVKFFCFELGLHIRFIVGVALSEALGEKFAQPLIVLFHVELNFLFFFHVGLVWLFVGVVLSEFYVELPFYFLALSRRQWH